MKTLGTMWTFVWVLVIVGSVNCRTIAYPERAALLSYNPSRGEFPVQSLFGHGYFSFIDENGNSRIVALEANPLLGVRLGANGQPHIDTRRSLDLENQKEDGNRKHDRLKPIKEFDENPFVDSVIENLVSTSAPDSLKDATKASLLSMPMELVMIPGQQPQVITYLPPATPADNLNDAKNDLPVSMPLETVTVPEQQVLVNMYPPPSATADNSKDATRDLQPSLPIPTATVPGQQSPLIIYLSPSAPADNSKDARTDLQPSLPIPTATVPGQQSPLIMYLSPSAPADNSKDATKDLQPSFPIPTATVPEQQRSASTPADNSNEVTNDSQTSLPIPTATVPEQQRPVVMYLLPTAPADNSNDTTKDTLPSLPSQPVITPGQQSQVIMYLPPTGPAAVLPRQGTPVQGILSAGNPFLSSNIGLVFSNPLPVAHSRQLFLNPSPPSTPDIVFPNSPVVIELGVFPNPPPPSAAEVFPNRPMLIGSGVFPNPPPPTTTSPILGTGNPFLQTAGAPPFRPAATVFPNPSLPVNTVFPNPSPPAPTVFPNPSPPVPTVFPNLSPPASTVVPNRKPPTGNPFLSPNSIQDRPSSSTSATILKPSFKPNEKNPFLPSLPLVVFDPYIRSLKVDSSSSPLDTSSLDADQTVNIPEQVKDSPEVEQAKSEHFLAHKLAVERLKKAHQQIDRDNNDQRDESLLSPTVSVPDSSLVYLPPDVASPQASGPSTIVITEQTNDGTADDVSQALPVV